MLGAARVNDATKLLSDPTSGARLPGDRDHRLERTNTTDRLSQPAPLPGAVVFGIMQHNPRSKTFPLTRTRLPRPASDRICRGRRLQPSGRHQQFSHHLPRIAFASKLCSHNSTRIGRPFSPDRPLLTRLSQPLPESRCMGPVVVRDLRAASHGPCFRSGERWQPRPGPQIA